MSRCKNENGWTETCHITNGLGEKRNSPSHPSLRQSQDHGLGEFCHPECLSFGCLDVLNEERARKQEQNYNSETDRIEDLRRVDEAIKKVIEALNADSTVLKKLTLLTLGDINKGSASKAEATVSTGPTGNTCWMFGSPGFNEGYLRRTRGGSVRYHLLHRSRVS